jgi:1-acyl-sn-glycerol-3-phosphate acyltransferase
MSSFIHQCRFFLALLWSFVIFSLILLLALLTLGVFQERLISVFGPFWGKSLLWISGIPITIEGGEKLQTRHSQVIICNHGSILDMVVGAVLDPPHLLGIVKTELKWMPVFGLMWWLLGQSFVDRSSPERARKTVGKIVEKMQQRPRSVLLAPEGTCSKDGSLGPFKMGAFHLAMQAKVPVVPVVIQGVWAILPPGSFKFRPQPVRVVVKDPIPPEHWKEEFLRAQVDELQGDFKQWLAAENAEVQRRREGGGKEGREGGGEEGREGGGEEDGGEQ